jgi:electron transfer flavoprotein alpha subunit
MAAQVFAFIDHKDGAADDSALELISAARNIFPDASPTAILTGAGAGLDAVCQAAAASYRQVWKFDQAALTYPNAELIRLLLLKVLPKGAVLLLPHNTFGMDLGPGLSVKIGATFIPDVVAIDGPAGATLTVVRQEFNGQASTHLVCDVSNGAVISVRSGSFRPDESRSAGGQVVEIVLRHGHFTFQGRAVLSQAVDEAIAGHSDQEGAQLIDILKDPLRLPQARQQIGPDRLHDVRRIELSAKRTRELAANHHPQVRLKLDKNFLRRGGIAGVQPRQQAV